MSPDTLYLKHILRAARFIVEFVEGFDSGSFERDGKTKSAVNWQLAVIGEATKQISKEFRSKHPAIAWKQMAGMRDRLIHGYDSINLERVWGTATVFVPELIAQLESLVSTEEEDET